IRTLSVHRTRDTGSLNRSVRCFPRLHPATNMGNAMKTHLLQPLCCQGRAQASGAVKDQFLPRSEDLFVSGTFRVGVEFQRPSRGMNGAGNLAVALYFWEIANIDKDDAFRIEVFYGFRRRDRLDRGTRLGHELLVASGDGSTSLCICAAGGSLPACPQTGNEMELTRAVKRIETSVGIRAHRMPSCWFIA